jgi:hypothetical protein
LASLFESSGTLSLDFFGAGLNPPPPTRCRTRDPVCRTILPSRGFGVGDDLRPVRFSRVPAVSEDRWATVAEIERAGERALTLIQRSGPTGSAATSSSTTTQQPI